MYYYAAAKSLKGNNFRKPIVEILRPKVLIILQTQRERYLYHVIREAEENGMINCLLPDMAHKRRAVYHIIATIWPDIQFHATKRYKNLRKDIRTSSKVVPAARIKPKHTRSQNPPQKQGLYNVTTTAPQINRPLHSLSLCADLVPAKCIWYQYLSSQLLPR